MHGTENSTNPGVSVALITYNHEKFISQAIDGVLMQEADFPVELVIGEDCSTDNTRRIVEEYAQKYPGRIRLLPFTANLGATANTARTLAACNGEYVALLEGDDYWTDRRKLARQVEFFKLHPECALCFHNVAIVSDEQRFQNVGYHLQKDGARVMCSSDKPAFFSQKDFLERNYAPTCSVVFRRSALPEMPPWSSRLKIDDHVIYILCLEHGLAGYLPEVMAAYRLHSNGIWTGNNAAYGLEKTLEMYEELEKHYLGRPQYPVLHRCRLQLLWSYARSLRRVARYRDSSVVARTYLKLALADPGYCLANLSRVLRMLFFSIWRSGK